MKGQKGESMVEDIWVGVHPVEPDQVAGKTLLFRSPRNRVYDVSYMKVEGSSDFRLVSAVREDVNLEHTTVQWFRAATHQELLRHAWTGD